MTFGLHIDVQTVGASSLKSAPNVHPRRLSWEVRPWKAVPALSVSNSLAVGDGFTEAAFTDERKISALRSSSRPSRCRPAAGRRVPPRSAYVCERLRALRRPQ